MKTIALQFFYCPDRGRHTQTVLYNDGHLTRYTYDADGRKLKTEYILSNFRFAEFEPTGPLDPVFKPMASPLPGGSGGHITIDKDRFPIDSAIYMGPKTLMTVEYCGNYIYRNGKLERVLNDYGYYADGAYHFNITDYQGNIRAAIREDGTLEETNSYYPYGGLMGSGSMGVQPYKYGGKELDRENGLDLYDSHARMYDPIIGRTTTIDPLAEKYTHLSPYLWCAANPNRFIDEKGDSIAVLYLHGIVGHLALLIQNDNGKWAYYSMNGNNIYTSTNGSAGGKGYHDLGTKIFDSPMAFLNSSYNQEGKNKRDIQNDKVNNYGYEEAFVIPTTQKQDKKIREKFLSETHQSYNLVNRQCAQVVQKALNAAGIETNSSEMSYYDDMFLPDSTPYLPASTFIAIRYNNSKGIYIRKK